jgi:hypothetical protein
MAKRQLANDEGATDAKRRTDDISEDFEKIFESGIGSDFTIVCTFKPGKSFVEFRLIFLLKAKVNSTVFHE